MRPTIVVSIMAGLFVISLNFAADVLSLNRGLGGVVYPLACLFRDVVDVALVVTVPALFVRAIIRRSKTEQRFLIESGEIQTEVFVDADSPLNEIGKPEAGWHTIKSPRREVAATVRDEEAPHRAKHVSQNGVAAATNNHATPQDEGNPIQIKTEGVLLSNIKMARRRQLAR